jgi:1-acyl-sn-glycerol-3-phosphate acyltransferase
MFIEFKYYIANFCLWLFGWKLDTFYNNYHLFDDKTKNSINKCIIISEPHTHFLDFFIMKALGWYLKINVTFMINSKFMIPGLSYILYFLGALPVNKKEKGLTKSVVKEIQLREKIYLQLAPSGTRKKTDYWYSGFYYIALESNIPIVCTFIDCKTKTFGFSNPIYPTGNISGIMDEIREIYKDKTGFNENSNSTIILKEELKKD